MDYQLEQEEFVLPEVEYEVAYRRARLMVDAPFVAVFALIFGGASLLSIWPWTVSLLQASLLSAVYSVVAINQWQNWLSKHSITREEALLWRRRVGFEDRGRWLLGLIGGSAVLWLGSLLI